MSKMKREKLKQRDGLSMELVPGDKGDMKNAYIRLEDKQSGYIGAFDNDDMKALLKLQEWVNKIVEAQK